MANLQFMIFLRSDIGVIYNGSSNNNRECEMKQVLVLKTKAEIEYLLWLIEGNINDEVYYGNKTQYQKRRRGLKDQLDNLLTRRVANETN